MPLTESQRNALHKLVDACRDELKQAVAERLQAVFGIHSDGRIEAEDALSLPDEETVAFRHRLVTYVKHRCAQYPDPDSNDAKRRAVDRLTREAAFTHLNRFCAYKMLSARKVIEDPIGRGIRSRGFLFYAAENPEIETLIDSGRQERAFRLFLEWEATQLAPEMEALFSPDDPAAGLYPSQLVLDRILERLNADDLKPVWEDDETIGWVYQFFTTDDERKRLRKESAAPRNTYEMAVRNQFFTPRYIVEFLADNTLGRTWIEMCEGKTALTEQCRSLLRETQESLPRPKKDPREIRVLDPACGSGHFLLYAFELFLTIYAEAYDDPEAGKPLRESYPDREAFDRAVPALILENNLWGVDIDRRCAQIAALALSLRAERAWQEKRLKREERPRITKTNIVCAEPMPGEADLFADFARSLDPPLLADLVQSVFVKMENADTLGSLLKIEDDLRETIAEAKQQYADRGKSAVQMSLEMEQARPVTIQRTLDVDSLADDSFFEDAEQRVLKALQEYAEQAVAQGESETVGLSRRLFAGDAVQGFAFVDLCSQKFDVVLMNPPFGDAAIPSKPYIEATYGDTKGDVYKAFIECFQDRLVPGGYLGAITSRTGFFLGQSADWRERVVLRLYRPLVMADLGMGVLDAMVETAAYVLRSLTEEERSALTLSLAERLSEVKADKGGRFTRAGYQRAFDLKKHQAEQELAWLVTDGFVSRLPGAISAKTGKLSPVRYQVKAGATKNVPPPTETPTTLFTCLRLMAGKTNEVMRQGLEEVLADPTDKRCFAVNPEDFKLVPGQPFSYWASNHIRNIFAKFSVYERGERYIQAGASTKDDFHFTRAWWEISSDLIAKSRDETLADKQWVTFSKGGGYSPYYNHSHLVVDWGNDGETLKKYIAEYRGSRGWGFHWTAGLNGYEDYFRPGLSWAVRTHRFAPHIVPSGGIFSAARYQAFANNSDLMWLLGLMNGEPVSYLLRLSSEWFERPKFIEGLVAGVPIPSPSETDKKNLAALSTDSVVIKRDLDTVNETSHVFQRPALLAVSGDTLEERAAAWSSRVEEIDTQLAANQREVDDIAFRLYGIKGDDRRAIEETLVSSPALSEASEDTEIGETEGDDEPEEDTNETRRDRRTLAEELVSYAVGCAFGRFDIRLGAGLREPAPLPDPFAPLPVCSPGMLTGADGLPCAPPEGYPLVIDTDGILVEDADERGTPRHPDDIVIRVQAVLRVLFGDQADAIEVEACGWLGVANLREYFRRPGAGGFWQDHIKRYSKSRRKAPIYWLLQSRKKNYSLWLYAHKLDSDTLFKALLNYVEQPMLKRERDALDALRTQIAALPAISKERRDAEKLLEKQESLVNEMTDFCENLTEAAHRRLTPDLNDGVVLTIAPLCKLVPWKEAADYWKALQAGKYPWANIAQQLAQKG